MKEIKPKQDYVLIQVVEKGHDDGMTKTKSGIYLPGKEAAKTTAGFSHDTHKFEVIGVGPNVQDISNGDLVLFLDHQASSIKDDDDRLLVLVKEQFIFAAYED